MLHQPHCFGDLFTTSLDPIKRLLEHTHGGLLGVLGLGGPPVEGAPIYPMIEEVSCQPYYLRFSYAQHLRSFLVSPSLKWHIC